MRWWRFVGPGALGWTLRQGRDFLVDRIRGAPPRALQARDFVGRHARRGNESSSEASIG